MKKIFSLIVLFCISSSFYAGEFKSSDFNLMSPVKKVESTLKDISEVKNKLVEIQNKLQLLEGSLKNSSISKPIVKKLRQHGAIRKSTDGKGNWTWNANEKIWWRWKDDDYGQQKYYVPQSYYQPSYYSQPSYGGYGGYGGFSGGGGSSGGC